MTSAFGTVRNSTGEDITIVGASTPAAKRLSCMRSLQVPTAA
ncbi:hypothetical protein NHF46_00510 [Arthrobacter alpinus]|nr:hypothetical protein [Arthrobacter alpinus]